MDQKIFCRSKVYRGTILRLPTELLGHHHVARSALKRAEFLFDIARLAEEVFAWHERVTASACDLQAKEVCIVAAVDEERTSTVTIFNVRIKDAVTEEPRRRVKLMGYCNVGTRCR